MTKVLLLLTQLMVPPGLYGFLGVRCFGSKVDREHHSIGCSPTGIQIRIVSGEKMLAGQAGWSDSVIGNPANFQLSGGDGSLPEYFPSVLPADSFMLAKSIDTLESFSIDLAVGREFLGY